MFSDMVSNQYQIIFKKLLRVEIWCTMKKRVFMIICKGNSNSSYFSNYRPVWVQIFFMYFCIKTNNSLNAKAAKGIPAMFY